MKNFEINTATLFEKGHFTGNTIYKDFCRCGYITIKFRIVKRKIQAYDVNGFEIMSCCTYVKNPKNIIEKKNNQYFLNRFYKDLEVENKQILVNALFK